MEKRLRTTVPDTHRTETWYSSMLNCNRWWDCGSGNRTTFISIVIQVHSDPEWWHLEGLQLWIKQSYLTADWVLCLCMAISLSMWEEISNTDYYLMTSECSYSWCGISLCCLVFIILTPALYCAITNQFCAIVLFQLFFLCSALAMSHCFQKTLNHRIIQRPILASFSRHHECAPLLRNVRLMVELRARVICRVEHGSEPDRTEKNFCCLNVIILTQWFPTCLGLRHPAEENYILRHPVANPYNFASRFDDSLKVYF